MKEENKSANLKGEIRRAAQARPETTTPPQKGCTPGQTVKGLGGNKTETYKKKQRTSRSGLRSLKTKTTGNSGDMRRGEPGRPAEGEGQVHFDYDTGRASQGNTGGYPDASD